MLRGAETLSADSGVVNETLVEALVREDPLATKQRVYDRRESTIPVTG